jgi:two-component system LytT family response regulator
LNSNLKIVLIEDELHSREFLRKVIASYTSGFEIVGEAETIEEGITVIRESKPDILLMDIELRDGLSFKILEELEHLKYNLIFITSHVHYTLKALKLSAIDYILKPVGIDELAEALEKARTLNRSYELSLNLLKENLQVDPEQIIVYSRSKYLRLDLNEVLAFVSDGSYTRIMLEDKQYLVHRSLSYYEDILPANFIRSHKSCILNCNYIKSIDSGRGGSVYMANGMELQVAYRRKSELLSRIQGL